MKTRGTNAEQAEMIGVAVRFVQRNMSIAWISPKVAMKGAPLRELLHMCATRLCK